MDLIFKCENNTGLPKSCFSDFSAVAQNIPSQPIDPTDFLASPSKALTRRSILTPSLKETCFCILFWKLEINSGHSERLPANVCSSIGGD